MKRIIVRAKTEGPHKPSGLVLKRDEVYEIGGTGFDEKVFEKIGDAPDVRVSPPGKEPPTAPEWAVPEGAETAPLQKQKKGDK